MQEGVPAPGGVSRLQFSAIFSLLLLNAVGVSTLLSLLAPAARLSHIPDALIVLAQALSALSWALVGRFWSRAGDRHGHKRIMIIGAAGSCAATLLTGLAIWVGVHGLVPPMVALAALMIGRSAYGGVGLAGFPSAQAFVARRTSRDQRGAALSSLASAQGFGTVIGPALAPFLLGLPGLGLPGPLFVIATLMLMLIPFLFAILPDDTVASQTANAAAPRAASLWRDPDVGRHLIYSMVTALALSASLQTIGFLVIDTTGLEPMAAQPLVGRSIIAGALAALFVQLVVIRRAKMSPQTLMRLGPALGIVGALALAFTLPYAGIVVAVVVLNAGFAFIRPGVSTAASLAVPHDRQGEVAGALLSTFSLGIIAGPVLGVGLYGLWRPLPFLLIAVLLAVAAALVRSPRTVALAHDETAGDDPIPL